MATLKDLRTQAKARKVKGYSRMNKSQLMSALGVSEKSARPKGDARARSTAKRSGVAKTFAADKLSAKLAGGDAEKAATVKKEVLKRVSKNLRAAEKAKGDKLTPQEKRAAAVKAIRQVADEQRKASGKNIPLTQGMSPEQREKEKKQFLAQMKRQQTIAQKKADRPNLTAVEGGKKEPRKPKGQRMLDRADAANTEAEAKFADAKARADELRGKKVSDRESVIKNAEKTLRDNPYVAGSDTDRGGGWQRVEAATKLAKSGEWDKMKAEDQASFFETMGNVTPSASKKKAPSQIAEASIQLQHHLYHSLSDKQKSAIAKHLVDSGITTELHRFADHANPELKSIGNDVAQRMSEYRKSKKKRTRTSGKPLEDLF